MSHILSLGAINKITGEYVYPRIANKNDTYGCPYCDKDVFPRQGKRNRWHFAHKNSDNPCNYYNHPGESQIHKDAKMLMKMLLDNKIPVSFIRACICCKEHEEFEIPEVDANSLIYPDNNGKEYSFEYNGSRKSADVAYIQDGELICIFEICNTHRTCSENRPEPWFEIDAILFINTVNENAGSSLKIPCIRNKKCDECIEREKIIQQRQKLQEQQRQKLQEQELSNVIEETRMLMLNKLKLSITPMQKKKWSSLLDLILVINPSFIDFGYVLMTDTEYYINITHPITKQIIHYHLKRDYILTDSSFAKGWKINNVIDWLKSNGVFNRCVNCECIYSFSKKKACCTNEYCIK